MRRDIRRKSAKSSPKQAKPVMFDEKMYFCVSNKFYYEKNSEHQF
jgi:hypothetical protein